MDDDDICLGSLLNSSHCTLVADSTLIVTPCNTRLARDRRLSLIFRLGQLWISSDILRYSQDQDHCTLVADSTLIVTPCKTRLAKDRRHSLIFTRPGFWSIVGSVLFLHLSHGSIGSLDP